MLYLTIQQLHLYQADLILEGYGAASEEFEGGLLELRVDVNSRALDLLVSVLVDDGHSVGEASRAPIV